MSTITVGDLFAQPNDPTIDLKSTLDSYLDTIGNQSLTIIYTNTGTPEDTLYNGIRIYDSIVNVQALIADQVCEQGLSSVFLIINPHIAPSVVITDPLEIERVLKELTSKNVIAGGIVNKGERERALEEIRHEIEHESDPSDYRFTYELMKNRIYGEEHEEAFDLLREAAEIAIDYGQANYLLDRINGEKESDLWKLSHGHAHEWNPIIEALEHNDKDRLHSEH